MVRVSFAVPVYCECGAAFRNRNDSTMDCQNPGCPHQGKIFRQPTLEAHEVATPNAEPGNRKKEFRAVPNKGGEKI